MENLPEFSVSDFVALTNQTLEYAYPMVLVTGEVESFKVNQSKYVFFNIKDGGASVGCFMMVFALRVPIEDGMRVTLRARPKLTKFGKFSLTVDSIRPVGEGAIKKSFELLRAKLEQEGIFAPERKRLLPKIPRRVGVVASVQSAGYADFVKIIGERWAGLTLVVHHATVQGEGAPAAIMAALDRLNQIDNPLDVIVLLRGGGSADDLAAFNDEPLVRAIAASRTPTMMAVGHEVDVTLCDMAADVRASTPSNAAQILTPDAREVSRRVEDLIYQIKPFMMQNVAQLEIEVNRLLESARQALSAQVESRENRVQEYRRLLASYDPANILRRGYAIVRGVTNVGESINVETKDAIVTAKVIGYERKK